MKFDKLRFGRGVGVRHEKAPVAFSSAEEVKQQGLGELSYEYRRIFRGQRLTN